MCSCAFVCTFLTKLAGHSFVSGFHDTSLDTFDPAAPDFKRLRQHHLDGTRRDEIEEVCMYVCLHVAV